MYSPRLIHKTTNEDGFEVYLLLFSFILVENNYIPYVLGYVNIYDNNLNKDKIELSKEYFVVIIIIITIISIIIIIINFIIIYYYNNFNNMR